MREVGLHFRLSPIIAYGQVPFCGFLILLPITSYCWSLRGLKLMDSLLHYFHVKKKESDFIIFIYFYFSLLFRI